MHLAIAAASTAAAFVAVACNTTVIIALQKKVSVVYSTYKTYY